MIFRGQMVLGRLDAGRSEEILSLLMMSPLHGNVNILENERLNNMWIFLMHALMTALFGGF